MTEHSTAICMGSTSGSGIRKTLPYTPAFFWRFLTVGGVGQVACQGFLVREACVSVLVGGAGFLLSGVQ